MMCEILQKLPLELKLKVLGYKQSPPHYIAIISGLFPIRDSLLPPCKDDEWIYLIDSDSDSDDEMIFDMELTQSDHHFVSLPQPFHYSQYSDYFL